jgi:hypothetical protein
MTNSREVLAALVAEWRAEARELQRKADRAYSPRILGQVDSLLGCADELEAALRTLPNAGEGVGEVDAMMEALYRISLCSQSSMSSKEECGRIARAALRTLPNAVAGVGLLDAGEALGPWMAAALDDESACPEFKQAADRWLTAHHSALTAREQGGMSDFVTSQQPLPLAIERITASSIESLIDGEPTEAGGLSAEEVAALEREFASLLECYWGLAYDEGREGREHDTENADAQQVLHELQQLFRRLAPLPAAQGGAE